MFGGGPYKRVVYFINLFSMGDLFGGHFARVRKLFLFCYERGQFIYKIDFARIGSDVSSTDKFIHPVKVYNIASL